MDILIESGGLRFSTTYQDDAAQPYIELWQLSESETSAARDRLLTAWVSRRVSGHAIALSGFIRELPLEVMEAFAGEVRRKLGGH